MPSAASTSPRSSVRRAQLAFLIGLALYDIGMIIHVHVYQTGLEQIASSYAPVHPLWPLLDKPQPILSMDHVWWLVMLHGIGSVYPLLSVLVQLAQPVRERLLEFHRWNGRATLLVTVLLTAIPGVWMSASMLQASPPLRAAVGMLGGLTLLAAIQTWRSVRAGQIDAHRRWAVRMSTYIYVIPVVARFYLWIVWMTYTAPSDGIVTRETLNLTFELTGWITTVTLLPLGETMVWWWSRDEGTAEG